MIAGPAQKVNGKAHKKVAQKSVVISPGRAPGGGADRAGFSPGMVCLDALDFAKITGGLWPAEGLSLLRGEVPGSFSEDGAGHRQHDSRSDGSGAVAWLCAAEKDLLAQRTVAMIATVANLESLLTGKPEFPRFPRGWVAFDALEFSNISGGMTPEDALAILRGQAPEWVAGLFGSHRKVDPHGDPRDFYCGLQDLLDDVDCMRTALIFGTLGSMRRKAAVGNADTAGAKVLQAA